MRYSILIFAVSVLALNGCASQSTHQKYVDSVLNRPMPPTDEARKQECAWIRSEMARQQGLAGVGTSIATSSLMAAAYQAAARRNIAALESRAAIIQCSAAFSNAPVTNSEPNFEQCFSRCQEYTNRTKEQCFDACK